MSRKKCKKTPPVRCTFSGGVKYYTPIFEDIRATEAYRTLTPIQKCILFDMFRQYHRASCFDTENIQNTGFMYTHGHCQEDVSDTSFYDSVKAILKRGWFEVPPMLQELRPAAPKRYVPSKKWCQYEPTDSEKSRMIEREEKKRAKLASDRLRVVDHFAGRKAK